MSRIINKNLAVSHRIFGVDSGFRIYRFDIIEFCKTVAGYATSCMNNLVCFCQIPMSFPLGFYPTTQILLTSSPRLEVAIYSHMLTA